MLDKSRFREFMTKYKKNLLTGLWWEEEKFKWEAVLTFQSCWNPKDDDFAGMLSRSLQDTSVLLASAKNYPKDMIIRFAQEAPEEVRSMFQALFDEDRDAVERILEFKDQSAVLFRKYGKGNEQHYQKENTISTYLWLRYPDRYYIYKYTVARAVAEKLGSEYSFKSGAYRENLTNCYHLYQEMCEEISADKELLNLIRMKLTDTCYSDPEHKILTVDVGFYIGRHSSSETEIPLQKPSMLSPEWFLLQAGNYPASDEEETRFYQTFQEKYAPDRLRALSDEKLLETLFWGVNEQSLCSELESEKTDKLPGSMAGESFYPYPLFYSKEEQSWKTDYGKGRWHLVAEEEALEIGKRIREALVSGADVIGEWEKLKTEEDYGELLDVLNQRIPQYISKTWVLKYYHRLFPDRISGFYSQSWQKHILCSLNIFPSDVRFLRMGQIQCFVNRYGLNQVFEKIVLDTIGRPRRFFRIEAGKNGDCFHEWYKENFIAVGWNELGDFDQFYQGGENSRLVLMEALRSNWGYSAQTASEKYREITNFYSATEDDTYIAAMVGSRLLGIGVFTGGSYLDEEKESIHCRPVRWLKVFREEKKLPVEKEELQTIFSELKNSENLCFLYSLLHGKKEKEKDRWVPDSFPTGPVSFYTGFRSSFSRNRIFFGAPGTGKSYILNQEKDRLLKDGGDYERVTFHPDYSYAHFVGAYKPVPRKEENGKDSITYAYVPGPFMRIYCKALQNSRTESIKPFLLIIEEINRADTAAVFGDIFQLLDRSENETSEYPIQVSEDVRKYLADTLGIEPEECNALRLPDNLFLWATMNSADQGVFPMDTAFKRRWDFTYLGIDACEGELKGKTVVLGQGKDRQRVEWNQLRKAINQFLTDNGINEDKQLGPYFLARKVVIPKEGNEISPEPFMEAFKSKVLMYLFEDAARQKRTTLFGPAVRYSEICRVFDQKGVFVFCEEIVSRAEPEKMEPASGTDPKDTSAEGV